MESVLSIKIDGAAARRDADKLSGSLNRLEKSGDSTGRAVSALNSKIVGLASVAGTAVLAGLTTGAVRTAKEFESLNRILSKSQFEFVRKESERLGLSLLTSASGFAKLSAATRGTRLEGEATQQIFSGLSTAVAGLSLSQEQANGALRAFEQIASKGTVQAEELRGQLGERIPGAFQIAARAIGLTTKELNKQLELGNVLSDDFLPKFAAELEKTYSQQALSGARQLNAEQNRLNTAFVELQNIFSNAGPLDAVTESTRQLTQALRSEGAINAVEAFGSAAAFLIRNLDTIGAGIAAFAGIKILTPIITSIVTQVNLATASVARFGVGLVALNAKAAATTAVMTGLRGALALVGGPAGLAVLAAGGLFTLATRASETEQSIAMLKSELQGYGSAVDVSTIKNRELAESFLKLNVTQAVDVMNKLKIELGKNNRVIDKTKKEISELEAEIERLGSGIAEQGGLNKELDDLQELLKLSEQNSERLTVELGLQRERVGDLSQSLREYREEGEQVNDANEQIKNSTQEVAGAANEADNSIQNLTMAAKVFGAEIDRQESLISNYVNVFGEYADAAEAVDAALMELNNEQLEQSGLLEELNRRYPEATRNGKEYKELLKKLGIETDDLSNKTVDFQELALQGWKKFQDGVQDAFFNAFRSGENFFDSLKNLAFDILAQIAAKIATTFVFNQASSLLNGTTLGNILGLGGNSPATPSGGGLNLGSLASIGKTVSSAFGAVKTSLASVGSSFMSLFQGSGLFASAGPIAAYAAAAYAIYKIGGPFGKIFDVIGDFFGGRSFSEIVTEDYLPDLLGSQNAREAVGANGQVGFNGGNTAIFGANFGITGSGLNSQLLVDGGENGNGGFFTGAQSSLDAFEELAKQNGFRVDQANGVLRVLSFDKTKDDIIELWRQFNDGLDGAVAFSEIFATATENNLIKPTNLFFENFATGFGQSAFEARDALLQIDAEFDKLVMGGQDASSALITALSDFYGISIDNAQEFVDKSGVSLEQWVANFTNASDDALSQLLDFNEAGITAFESATDSYTTSIQGLSGILDTIDLGNFRIPEIPAISVPVSVDTRASQESAASLGNFNSALSSSQTFTVPNSRVRTSGTDRLYTIGLTPRREEATISKAGSIEAIRRGQEDLMRLIASTSGSSNDDRIDRLVDAIQENNDLLRARAM